jgi:hypothetical protein
MRSLLALAVVLWVLCGMIGAWMLQADGDLRLKMIARGPITLVKAFHEAHSDCALLLVACDREGGETRPDRGGIKPSFTDRA